MSEESKQSQISTSVFVPAVPVFKVHDRPVFNVAPFERLSALNILSAMGLGFLLALLIFIDQNIVVSLTNAPENRPVCSHRTGTPPLPGPARGSAGDPGRKRLLGIYTEPVP